MSELKINNNLTLFVYVANYERRTANVYKRRKRSYECFG